MPDTADPSLHGNGTACPACELRRESEDRGAVVRPDVPCNVFGGTGRVRIADIEIIRRTCDEARRLYWSEFDRRVANA